MPFPTSAELPNNVCSCRGPPRARWPCCSSAGLQHAAPTGRPALKLGCGFASLSHSFAFSSPAFITKSQCFIFFFISLQLGFQSQKYTARLVHSSPSWLQSSEVPKRWQLPPFCHKTPKPAAFHTAPVTGPMINTNFHFYICSIMVEGKKLQWLNGKKKINKKKIKKKEREKKTKRTPGLEPVSLTKQDLQRKVSKTGASYTFVQISRWWGRETLLVLSKGKLWQGSNHISHKRIRTGTQPQMQIQ